MVSRSFAGHLPGLGKPLAVLQDICPAWEKLSQFCRTVARLEQTSRSFAGRFKES
jgi:hypothetical protein